MRPAGSSRATFAATALLAAALAAGCATTTPYSQLSGKRYHLAPIDTYPVFVTRVDGTSYLDDPVLVEPGRHKVVLQGPPGAASRIGVERTLDLDVKPCVRYYLVARKQNRLADDFEPIVDHEEPVPGCAAASAH